MEIGNQTVELITRKMAQISQVQAILQRWFGKKKAHYSLPNNIINIKDFDPKVHLL